MANYLWWEKTVEYFYVQKYLEKYRFVCPLDGEHEKASDTLLSDLFKWIVIEFKKDKNWRPSEIKKFPEGKYYDAKNHFEKIYDSNNGMLHHSIVYGHVDENGDLELKREKYFSEAGKDVSTPDDLISFGLDRTNFSEYIEKLIEFKAGGSGGMKWSPIAPNNPNDPNGVSSKHFHIVVGISKDEKKITFMTIEEFLDLEKPSAGQKLPKKVSSIETKENPETMLG